MKSSNAPSGASVVVLYLMIAAAGLYALPALLAPSARQGGAPSATAILWVLSAGLLIIVSIVLGPALYRTVRQAILYTPWFATSGPHAVPEATSAWVSFPVVSFITIALGEMILRPAIVAVLGGPIDARSTDALIAVTCLVVLILLLARLQQAARPWIEAGAWYTLDACIATSNSEGSRRFYDTGQHRTLAVITQRQADGSNDVTRAAPNPTGHESTVFAGEVTVAAASLDVTAAVPPSTDESSERETLLQDGPTEPRGRKTNE